MDVRTVFTAVAVLGALLGCEPEGDRAEPRAGPRPETAARSFAGMYEVRGMTVEEGSGRKRDIKGRILLAEQGVQYTATFDLETVYPTRDGPARADVIGKGAGAIEGETLRGRAETQLVMATVPGVDTKFAFVPRLLGPRIVSTTEGRFAPDGTLIIEIRSEGIQGEHYLPTRTVLRGRQLPPEELGAVRPPAGAGSGRGPEG